MRFVQHHSSHRLSPAWRGVFIFALGAATAVAVQTSILSSQEQERAKKEIEKAVLVRLDAEEAIKDAEHLARQVLQPLAIDTADRVAVHGLIQKIFAFDYLVGSVFGEKRPVPGSTFGKIFMMYDWIQVHVEYEDGKPGNGNKRSSSEVLATGKGNCYEQVTLFNAMIKAVYPDLVTRFVVTEPDAMGVKHTYLEAAIGPAKDLKRIRNELAELFQQHYGFDKKAAGLQVKKGMTSDGETLFFRFDVSLRRIHGERERLPSTPGDSCIEVSGCEVSRISYERYRNP